MSDVTVGRDGGLTGAGIDALVRAIERAFDKGELKELVRIRLDMRLEELVSEDLNLHQLVFELLEKLENRGLTVPFLRAVRTAREKKTELINAIEIHCPEAARNAPDPKKQANTVAKAVEEVTKRTIEQPRVHQLVSSRKGELVQLMRDIDVLANYKKLHDGLHTIQLRHYAQVSDVAKRLRDEPVAAGTLEQHVVDLQEIYAKVRKAAEALPDTAAVRQRELRWVDRLNAAIGDLQRAVEDVDSHAAQRALRPLRQIIRNEPFMVNDLLTSTAEKLHLEQLVATIAEVSRELVQGGSSTPELESALLSLQSILPQLRGRVAEHNQWQEIENDLWETEEFVDAGDPNSVAAFRDTWPDVKSRVEALAGLEPEAGWAKSAQALAGLIDGHLIDRVDQARTQFVRFRRAVLLHFYDVDLALRTQCEAILAIRAPLGLLLREV